MQLLFVHDHFFFEDGNGIYYSHGGLPAKTWDRYLNHFDEIVVIGRYGGTITGKQKLVKSSRPNVKFEFVDKISSIKGVFNVKKVKNTIKILLNNADAVVARLPSENGLLAANLAFKNKKPYALEVVGCAWDGLWNYGGLLSKLYAPLLYVRMKNTVKKSSNNLYVTRSFLQNRYKSKGSAYTVSVSNVDISDLKEEILIKRIETIKSHNCKNHITTFGIIGNFKTKYKGIHVAIEALGKLKQKHDFNNFTLKILGKGNPDDYKKLISKYQISRNIVFEGTLPNGRPVLNWLDNIDLYLQPSLTEGLPRTIIEAMSRGNIVIGSKVGGIPELLQKELIVKPRNIKDLQRKVTQVLNFSNEELISISKNNFEEAKKYHHEFLSKIRYEFYAHLKNQVQIK